MNTLRLRNQNRRKIRRLGQRQREQNQRIRVLRQIIDAIALASPPTRAIERVMLDDSFYGISASSNPPPKGGG